MKKNNYKNKREFVLLYLNRCRSITIHLDQVIKCLTSVSKKNRYRHECLVEGSKHTTRGLRLISIEVRQ